MADYSSITMTVAPCPDELAARIEDALDRMGCFMYGHGGGLGAGDDPETCHRQWVVDEAHYGSASITYSDETWGPILAELDERKIAWQVRDGGCTGVWEPTVTTWLPGMQAPERHVTNEDGEVMVAAYDILARLRMFGAEAVRQELERIERVHERFWQDQAPVG